MALRWVYDNIEFFNGDRKSITLFGPDAGAASAGLLMVNPKTSFMVSKVIAQVTKYVNSILFNYLLTITNKYIIIIIIINFTIRAISCILSTYNIITSNFGKYINKAQVFDKKFNW